MTVKWDVRKEIRVFGIQRSGNHAIINWILKQARGEVFYLNHGDPLIPFDKQWGYRQPPEIIDLFVHSYENRRFSPQVLKIANANRAVFYEYPETSIDVLVLRDPFNLFASRIRAGYVSSGRDDRYNQVDLWLYYADEYLGKTNHLGPNKLVVSYNRWCKDENYRRGLAKVLRLEFTDTGFNEVPRYGGGSSFEGVRMNGKASEMKTGERWRSLASDPRFITCFENPRVLSLSEEVFSEIEGTRQFVEANANHWKRLSALSRHLFARYVLMPLIDLRLWQERNNYILTADRVSARPKDG